MALTEPCPQCGWRPEIHCVACGYDLAGLDATALCPECATPIAESLRGDGLAFASPKYLAMLDKGLGYTRLGVGLLVSVYICGLLLSIIVGMLSSTSMPSWIMDVVVAGPVMICLGLWVAGWWMATTPDPRLAAEEVGRSNALARWMAMIFAVSVAGLLVGSPFLPNIPYVAPMLGVLLIFQYGAGSECLHRIAKRAGNRRAAAHARQVGVLVATIAACLVIKIVESIVAYRPPTGSGGAAVRLALGVVNLTILIGVIIVLVRQASAAGLLRDDMRRFLFHAKRSG